MQAQWLRALALVCALALVSTHVEAAGAYPSPIFANVTVNGSVYIVGCTGYLYGNGASAATCSPTLPPAAVPLTNGDILVGNASNVAAPVPMSGDATIANTGALTFATVNPTNVGTFGSATQVGQYTVNAKGLITAASNVSIAISLSQVTSGLGTGVATALGNTTNTSGGVITAGAGGYLQAAQEPAHTGDMTNTAGSLATTVAKVDGVSYGASPGTNTIPVVTGTNAVTYETAPIAAGGTGQTSAAAARASSGLNIDQESTNGDSTVTISSTTRTEATTTTLTASRAWTLPAASALNAGQHLVISDKAGAINGSNTIVVTAAGSDTINGASTATMASQYQVVDLVSDGVSKWNYNVGASGGSGTVINVATGAGLVGGPITTSGTVTLANTPPGGRLTTSSGVCTPTSDVAAATTIWYAPCNSPLVPVYNGTAFQAVNFTSGLSDTVGQSIALGSNWAANTLFDVFEAWNGGTPVLCSGPAWTSSTAGSSSRSAAITAYGGIQTNAASMTCRTSNSATITAAANTATYLGTFLTNGNAGQIDLKFGTLAAGGGTATAGIWNMYNRVPGAFNVFDSVTLFTNTVTSTFQPLDVGTSGGLLNRVNFVTGIASDAIEGNVYSCIALTASAQIQIGLGLNSTSAVWAKCTAGSANGSGFNAEVAAQCRGYGAVGLNYLQGLQYTASASDNFCTNGGSPSWEGINVTWWW